MADVPRILIVDDHRAIRDRLEDRIREELPGARTGKAPDLRAAFALATHGWDIVILDINLPDGNGIEALPALRGLLPAAAVIVMTVFPEPAHVRAMSTLGHAALVGKSELFERLRELLSAAWPTQRGQVP